MSIKLRDSLLLCYCNIVQKTPNTWSLRSRILPPSMEDSHNATTTAIACDLYGHCQISDQIPREIPKPDVHIITSGGQRIPAHRVILVLNTHSLSNFDYWFASYWTSFSFFLLDLRGCRPPYRQYWGISLIGHASIAAQRELSPSSASLATLLWR